MNTPTHIDGFNHGYTLQKYEPGLVEQIVKTIEPTTEYTDGFLSGRQQYEKEQLIELDKLRNQTSERDLEK